jgi:hypothetical protein
MVFLLHTGDLVLKVYILPTPPNRALLKVLYDMTLDKDYGALTQRLGMYLRSTKLDHYYKRQELLLLINKLYLSNIFKYTDSGSVAWFVQSLQNATIGHELNVNPCTISSFFKPLMGMGVLEHDVTEIENNIARDLNGYLTHKYNQNSSAFNEVLVNVYDMFHVHIPVNQVQVHRFELAPTLAPLVFYTNKHLQPG